MLDILFHLDEMPMLELTFYARRLSHIYLLVIVASIVVLWVYYGNQQTVLIVSCMELIVIFCTFVILRLIILNPKDSNIKAAIVFSVLLLLFVFSGTIYGAVSGSFNPMWFVVLPILWVLLQASSVYILWGFLRKLIQEENKERTIKTRFLDDSILYSNT